MEYVHTQNMQKKKNTLPLKQRNHLRGQTVVGSFEKLPPEFTECVTRYLDALDSCSPRLTCSYIHQCTLHPFRRSYLAPETVYTDFSRTPLSKLRRIEENLEKRD
ncbi:hypothetical protein BJY00DRAFT_107111 [Aspergillus carlsbadensis]|nr:hypothetical protein BJY00DRAFT_107111 [Aspergillus carlsbadensis]